MARETLFVGLTEKVLPIHITVWIDSNDAKRLGIKTDKNHKLSRTLNLIFPFNEPKEAFERVDNTYENISIPYRDALRKKS
jgi:hypothetical protein